ncbi:potassium transporter KefB [Sabulibacter ruber]|uniref:potassium transporter KefB n=1 Tax=Sabulibacter ruber TaxID=2811901 RepID=UPI001A961EDA|nr:potassium transporter KefB [Sabulibacter ruber]
MTQKNTTTQTNPPLAPVKPVVVGAVIALLVALFFVVGADAPSPAWGKYWMVRPLIIIPLAGAAGGAFYAFMMYQSARGFNRVLAVLLGIGVYLVGLWLGVVLGLDGTMWD